MLPMQRAFDTEPQHSIYIARAPSLSLSRTPHPHPAPATRPSPVCFAVLAWAMRVLLSQWQQLVPQGCDFAGILAPCFRGGLFEPGILGALGAAGMCVPGGGEGGGVPSSCCVPLVKVCLWLLSGLWHCWLGFTLQKTAVSGGGSLGLHVYASQGCIAWARLAVAHGSSSLLLPCNCRVAWAIEGKGWLVTGGASF